ncbi:hypothetical protein [Streptomyces sp. NPDC008317]|uniref:hypothetical protein n=1 Tax=Streptomyces sp. NPDC008317 TaxID=3364827 RepID=UPI0036ED55C3
MSGRGIRASGVALGVIALLSACSSGGSTHRPVVTDSARVTIEAPPPVGSIEHPRPVACVEAVRSPGGSATEVTTGNSPARSTGSTTIAPTSPSSTSSSSDASASSSAAPATAKNDVTVGPLTWTGLRALADGDQTGHGYHNSDGWHYKVAASIRTGSTVTLTIGAEQRAKAGLEYGRAFGSTPAPAITFDACPAQPVVFIGGFFVAGDGHACVPVDVQVGQGAPRRVVISFFNGQCPAA